MQDCKQAIIKKYKATGLVFIRKFIQQSDWIDEKNLLNRLSEEEENHYTLAVTNQWIPLRVVEKIYEVASDLIFPGDPEGIEKISMLHAQDSIKGIYKIIFKFLTPAFVISQSSKMWQTYNNYGRASYVMNERNKTAMMIVEDVPDMTVIRQKMITGYIKGVMSMTNASKYKVELNASDPMQWRWEGFWET